MLVLSAAVIQLDEPEEWKVEHDFLTPDFFRVHTGSAPNPHALPYIGSSLVRPDHT